MKPTRTLRRFLAVTGSSLLAISSASADQNWDGTDIDDNFWSSADNWGLDGIPTWATAINFSGNTQNLTNNNLTADTTIGGINFTNDGSTNNTNAFTLSGARITFGGNITTTANTAGSTITDEISLALLLDATRTITTSQLSAVVQHNLTISGDISASGAFGITKAGSGTLTLSGVNNSYTGAVAVNAGVLNIRDDTALGTIAGGGTVASGAALEMQGGIAVGNESLGLSGTGISSGGALRNISGNNSYAGLITLNASGVRINSDSGLLTLDVASGNAITGSNRAIIFGGAGDITVADSMSLGSVTNAVTKDGAGNLTLGANNSYLGMTVISGGSITVSSVKLKSVAQPLGTGGTPNSNFGINFSNGGKLIYNGSGDTTDMGFTLSGNGVIEANNATGTLNFNSAINRPTGAFSMTLSGTGNGEWSGAIARANASGSTTIIKEGTGTWTLSGSNTTNNGPAGGFDVNNGTLLATQQTALSPLYNTAGHVTVANGATLALRAGASSGWTATEIGNLLGAATFASGSNLGIDVNNLDTFTYGNNIGITQAAKGFVKSGAGTLTLSGANTYTGVTKLAAGTLSVGSIGNGGVASGNLGSATSAAANIVFDGGTLQYTGANATSDRAFTINAGKTATIETANNLSFAGATGAATDGALTKTGAGTLTLTGTNTYTGATMVSAGTLFVTGSLASAVTVSDSATIGGGGTVGALSLGGGSLYDIFLAIGGNPLDSTTTISFSATGFGIDNLVSNGLAVDWGTVLDGTYTLIHGALDETNLGNFGLANAYDIGGSRSAYFQEGSLQLVVIPEPRAALLGGIGMLLLLRRRR